MDKIFRIRLKRLRFYSKIGVFSQEREVGNEFEVNLEVEYDASSFCEEELATTISYADIYEEVAEIMNREWLLLESVVSHISKRLLLRWPMIFRGKIAISKIAPPIPGICGESEVEFFFEKS